MDRALAVRLVSLYAPAALAVLPWLFGAPSRVRVTAALLACAWNLPALVLVNVIATRVGWWSFASGATSLMGVPLELLLGWVVLWGALPVLAGPRLPMAVTVATLAVLDVLVMPLADPVVVLGDSWFAGEMLAIAVALIPGLFLARCTERDTRVAWRAGMQAAVLTSFLVWLFPAVVFEQVGGSWQSLLAQWDRWAGLPLQLATVPAIVGMAAVREFAERGQGTPIPFDPPRRLVTSGPYAYVANPMQLSMALVLVGWGAVIQSWLVAAGGVMAVFYGVGLAAIDEGADMRARFGVAWLRYRAHVRSWAPAWRPWHPALTDPAIPRARLYVAAGCGQCSEVARWFAARCPRALDIVPAEEHPTRDLVRVTYDPCDGSPDLAGVAAIARALEHIHLGWAMAAWLIRVPGLTPILQLIADASGAEARLVRRPEPAMECST